jgi:hypothetical protein
MPVRPIFAKKKPRKNGASLMSRAGVEPATIGLKGRMYLQNGVFCECAWEKALHTGLAVDAAPQQRSRAHTDVYFPCTPVWGQRGHHAGTTRAATRQAASSERAGRQWE